MKFVVFGLTISSAWGNGHATLWRSLCARCTPGHRVVFFERDVPSYASHRDLRAPKWCELVLYEEWDAIAGRARMELAGADAAIVTSYCTDARQASGALPMRFRTICTGARSSTSAAMPGSTARK